MKRPRINRPLVPVVFSCIGGILFGHRFLSAQDPYLLPFFAAVILLLVAAWFLPSTLRSWAVLSAFFFLGILGDQGTHNASKLTPIAEARRQVTVQGTLMEPGRIIGDTARIKVRASSIFLDGERIPVNELLSVTLYKHPPLLRPGEKIRFPARLRPFKNFNNPGRYDYESAMKMAGFSCAASVSDGRRVVPMGAGDLPFPLGLLEKLRAPIREFLQEKLNPRDRALIDALILGERQGIDPDMREPFNRSGLGHVLAVSGLHIGLIAAISFLLFKGALCGFYSLALRRDLRKIAALLTFIPVVVYAGLAGFQVSSQRAMIMILVFLASIILGRERDTWSSVAAAALFILVWDPHALYSISFQLSFTAVIGILWLTPAILKKIPPLSETEGVWRYVGRLYVYFSGLFVVSLAATIFLLPMTCFYFHRISLISILANVTVVPILGLLVLPFALLATFFLPFFHPLADLFLQGSVQGLHWAMGLIRFWSGLPYCSFRVVTPSHFEIVILYALLLFIPLFRTKSWAKFAILVSLCLLFVDAGFWMNRTLLGRDLRITFLDVGHGNAAVVELPHGKRMVIDGGGFPSDHFDVGEMVVAPFLWRSKISKVDYVVLTHPHADHMNGLRFIARWFDPEEFWFNGDIQDVGPFKELMNTIEEKGIRKCLPADLERGREINGVVVEVFHPGGKASHTDSPETRAALNNRSLVLRLSYQGKSFLFPGDIEHEGEKALLSHTPPASLKTDVLLAPHHGHESSCSAEFLESISPSFCIISSGENAAVFPYPKTISRLRSAGSGIIRIDRTGAAICTVSSDRLTLKTFLRD